MRTIVVNINDPGSQRLISEAKAAGRYVACHRPTKWGNPFSHLERSRAQFKVASRAEAIQRYAEWLPDQPELVAELASLSGKVLGCFCVPRPCHVYIIARLADEAAAGRSIR